MGTDWSKGKEEESEGGYKKQRNYEDTEVEDDMRIKRKTKQSCKG